MNRASRIYDIAFVLVESGRLGPVPKEQLVFDESQVFMQSSGSPESALLEKHLLLSGSTVLVVNLPTVSLWISLSLSHQ